jgi:hypothetical protein
LLRPPRAASEKHRPSRQVTRTEWEGLSVETRNAVLDEASQTCGYKKECKGKWDYDSIFPGTPNRKQLMLTCYSSSLASYHLSSVRPLRPDVVGLYCRSHGT